MSKDKTFQGSSCKKRPYSGLEGLLFAFIARDLFDHETNYTTQRKKCQHILFFPFLYFFVLCTFEAGSSRLFPLSLSCPPFFLSTWLLCYIYVNISIDKVYIFTGLYMSDMYISVYRLLQYNTAILETVSVFYRTPQMGGHYGGKAQNFKSATKSRSQICEK